MSHDQEVIPSASLYTGDVKHAAEALAFDTFHDKNGVSPHFELPAVAAGEASSKCCCLGKTCKVCCIACCLIYCLISVIILGLGFYLDASFLSAETDFPTFAPTISPTDPTPFPSSSPIGSPTRSPTKLPTTLAPTLFPTTNSPSLFPTTPEPTQSPTSLVFVDNVIEFEAMCRSVLAPLDADSPRNIVACFGDIVAICNLANRETSFTRCPNADSCGCQDGIAIFEDNALSVCSGEYSCSLFGDVTSQVGDAILQEKDDEGAVLALNFLEACETTTIPITACLNSRISATCDPLLEGVVVLESCSILSDKVVCNSEPGIIQPTSESICFDQRKFYVSSLPEFAAFCANFDVFQPVHNGVKIFTINTCLGEFSYECFLSTGRVNSLHCTGVGRQCSCEQGLVLIDGGPHSCASRGVPSKCTPVDKTQLPLEETLNEAIDEGFSLEGQDVAENFLEDCTQEAEDDGVSTCINPDIVMFCIGNSLALTERCDCTGGPVIDKKGFLCDDIFGYFYV